MKSSSVVGSNWTHAKNIQLLNIKINVEKKYTCKNLKNFVYNFYSFGFLVIFLFI